MPDPGWESFAHGHSCLNYLPNGLLQFTLYGAALEQPLEVAAVTECSGLGSYMHSSIQCILHLCSTSCIRCQSAFRFNSRCKALQEMCPGYREYFSPIISNHPLGLERKTCSVSFLTGTAIFSILLEHHFPSV